MLKMRVLKDHENQMPSVNFPVDGDHAYYTLCRQIKEALDANCPFGAFGKLEYEPSQKVFFIQWEGQVCLPVELQKSMRYGRMNFTFTISHFQGTMTDDIEKAISQLTALQAWHNTNEQALFQMTQEVWRGSRNENP